MDNFDFANISGCNMAWENPTTPEKIVALGEHLRLRAGSRVIDFGCGYGEALALWAEQFGITGVGVDLREHACERAREKMAQRGLARRIEIICASGSDYAFEAGSFDAAVCLGATFIWGGFQQTVRAMSHAIQRGGRLSIGEEFRLRDSVPPDYAQPMASVLSEFELLQIARSEGFELEQVIRASHDDWDRYESSRWQGLLRWIEAHPDHPERDQVVARLHENQDAYLRYGREFLGWAMFVLAPSLPAPAAALVALDLQLDLGRVLQMPGVGTGV